MLQKEAVFHLPSHSYGNVAHPLTHSLTPPLDVWSTCLSASSPTSCAMESSIAPTAPTSSPVPPPHNLNSRGGGGGERGATERKVHFDISCLNSCLLNLK